MQLHGFLIKHRRMQRNELASQTWGIREKMLHGSGDLNVLSLVCFFIWLNLYIVKTHTYQSPGRYRLKRKVKTYRNQNSCELLRGCQSSSALKIWLTVSYKIECKSTMLSRNSTYKNLSKRNELYLHEKIHISMLLPALVLKTKLDQMVVVHTLNPSTWEAEAGGSL